MDTALVTVTIGEKYESLARVTHPTLKRYADKIESDFVVIDEQTIAPDDFMPHYAKLKLYDLLREYKRIVFVDTDIIIRDDTPDLFDLVPEHKMGLFREGEFIPRRKMDLEKAAERYSTPILGIKSAGDWKGEYYNTGVLVCSRQHKTIFTSPDFDKIQEVEGAADFGEQCWLNLQIINGDIPIQPLHYSMNRMSVMDDLTGEHRLASFIVHYAGAPDLIETQSGTITLPKFIERDLSRWESSKDFSEFKRGIYIRVGGGVGDQVDAEPVVREIIRRYDESDILVATDFIEVFRHLPVKLATPKEIDNFALPDQPYYKMETLPIPESLFGATISHPLVHSTDYSAISCLKGTLPREKKQIRLSTTMEDLEKFSNEVGLDILNKIKQSIAIHPGLGWASKTFPSSYWQEIIDGVSKEVTVCLIGKKMGEDQGLVDIDLPDNCIDLRDKTDLGGLFLVVSTAPVLLSNDSGPVHIAGAFDNHIILIPTCKHPDHILPWRNGCQTYKALALYEDLMVDDICNLPTQVHGETIDWIPSASYTELSEAEKYMLKGRRENGDLLKYLPSVDRVIETSISTFKGALKNGGL